MFSVTTYKWASTYVAIMLAGVSNLMLAAPQPQPEFPYQAMVITENAKVYSGPDSVHYATDELPRDAVVEVYRHDPGGWCAIRPPNDSFSLVPESAVVKRSDELGMVIQEGVQAWVGTRLGTVENPLWQVKLRQDEEVAILGEASWPNPEGYSTIWYQIAPPAGEFRWIQMSDLRLPKGLNQLPTVVENEPAKANTANLIESQLPPAANPVIRQSSYQEADQQPVLTDPAFEDEAPSDQAHDQVPNELDLNPPSGNAETVNRGWRQASRPIRLADNRSVIDRSKPFKTPALDTPVIGAAPLTNNDDAASLDGRQHRFNTFSTTEKKPREENSPKLVAVEPISGPVSERIRKLELQLSTEMQKPPAQWDMESILRQTTSIVSSTNEVREREHAQRLQQKIRNCVSIQTRYGDAFSGQPNRLPVSKPAPSTLEVQLGSTYDAHGWLNQLVRDNGRLSPTYVLEDRNGKITHHIGASPGLNLQRYVKKKVGVIGRRGYHQKLGLDHVTAERVVVINQLR